MPKDPTTGRRRECTLEERVNIIALNERGVSQRKIARTQGVARRTVSRILTQWAQGRQLSSAPRSGRPPVLTERDIRRIIRLSDSDPGATLLEITQRSGLPVCKETIARKLRKMGRYVRWARKKPMINAISRRKRLIWGRGQKSTTVRQWQRRIFTDEVQVELSMRGM